MKSLASYNIFFKRRFVLHVTINPLFDQCAFDLTGSRPSRRVPVDDHIDHFVSRNPFTSRMVKQNIKALRYQTMQAMLSNVSLLPSFFPGICDILRGPVDNRPNHLGSRPSYAPKKVLLPLTLVHP
jgi:hypothetical protein